MSSVKIIIIFFFFFSSFLLSFPLRTNNQTITIVHSAAWGSFVNEKRREEGLGNACMQHSSTETVKFPVLVLTRGALSRCKSILRRNTKFMRSNRGC